MLHLADRILSAPATAVVLALDECDVHRHPVLRAMWMRRGRQGRIPTPGGNRKRAVFGYEFTLEGAARQNGADRVGCRHA
jgi:hypothetical protein